MVFCHKEQEKQEMVLISHSTSKTERGGSAAGNGISFHVRFSSMMRQRIQDVRIAPASRTKDFSFEPGLAIITATEPSAPRAAVA